MGHGEWLKGKEFWYFLLHNLFRNYSLHLFFIYGSLLIYVKTQSVTYALLFSLVGSATVLSLQTFLLKQFLAGWNKLGTKWSMIVGLCAMAGSYLAIFFIPTLNFISLLGLGIFYSIGANFYYMPYHVIKFVTVGEAGKPGRSAALFVIVAILGTAAAAFTGFFVGEKNFPILFPIAGVLLLFAGVVLVRSHLHRKSYHAAFPDYMKSVPLRAHFSYAEFSHELKTTVIPLIVLFIFKSLSISIWVSGIAALGTLFGVWIAGSLRDKENPLFVTLFSATLFICWVFYAFAHSALLFAVLGLLIAASGRIIGTAVDAALGRDVVNSKPLPALFAVEFTKHASRMLALVVVLLVFMFTGELVQSILILGAIFELPRIYYALSHVPQRKIS